MGARIRRLEDVCLGEVGCGESTGVGWIQMSVRTFLIFLHLFVLLGLVVLRFMYT